MSEPASPNPHAHPAFGPAETDSGMGMGSPRTGDRPPLTRPADIPHGIPAEVIFWTLRRFWWVVAVLGLSLGLLATTLLASMNPGYESQARLLIGQLAGSTDSLRASASLGQTYADALASQTLLRRVAAQGGVPGGSVPKFVDLADVQFNDKSRILTIRITWSDPATAHRLTSFMVEEALGLKGEGPSAPAVKDPTPDVQQQTITREASGALTIIQSATMPDEPIDTHASAVGILSAIAGSLAAFTLLCFWVGRRHRKVLGIRRSLAARDYLGSADSGRTTLARHGDDETTLFTGRRAADYTRIAARAEVRSPVAPLRSVCVVGARGGPDAAAVALNLAAAFADAGRDVTLVDPTQSMRPPGESIAHVTFTSVRSPQEESELMGRLMLSEHELGDELLLLTLPSLISSPSSWWLSTANAVILVGQYEDPSVQTDLTDCMDAIARRGGRLLGVVLLRDGRVLGRLSSIPERAA